MLKVISMLKERKFARSPALGEIALALIGTLLLSINIPWALVFSSTTPGGGDNPGHPLLMLSIADAFFHHLSLIHYSYKFWSGFEAFQFYFPLPYLVGGILSQLLPWQIAFKIISILGILALPPAWYLMVRAAGMSRITGALASLLAVSFLHTEAHGMWGGNIASTLAGMIGNSWGFVFFSLAFGMLQGARDESKKTILPAIAILLAALSHFYAILMLALLFGIFFGEDLIQLFNRRFSLSRSLRPYLLGLVGVLLAAWWIAPLIAYQKFSSDFGGNWNISLLQTLSTHEKILFALSILLSPVAIWFGRSNSKFLERTLIFGGIYITLFFLSDTLNSAALSNIRLWPSIYFSLFAISISVFDRIVKASPYPRPSAAILALGFLALVPSEKAFKQTEDWMEWNFRGVETQRAAGEFSSIIDALNRQKPGRVSFESSDANNGLLGSVRTFELIPALTPHSIVEGGIVNSATFPGVGYTLQCLTSSSCAGWPNGSSMPERDAPRAVEAMRDLGVGYHIAQRPENTAALIGTGAFDILYRGPHYTLLKLKRQPSMVEVYDRALPVIRAERPHTLLLNLPRLDAMKSKGIVFDSSLTSPAPSGPRIDPVALINFINSEWLIGRHSKDRGWAKRNVDGSERYLNGVFVSLHEPFDLDKQLSEKMNYLISTRTFSSDLVAPNVQQKGSEAAIALIRDTSGAAQVTLSGRGYRAYQGDREIPLNERSILQFTDTEIRGKKSPFALLRFISDNNELYHDIDLSTQDKTIRLGLPGASKIDLPENITERCSPHLETKFHEMVLTTNCPRKPHLIKYSYFPKWNSGTPVSLGSNGYMVITPSSTRTVLKHSWRSSDYFGAILSIFGVELFLLLIWIERRGPLLLKTIDPLSKFIPYWFIEKLPKVNPSTERPLIIRPGGLGDLVILTDAFRELGLNPLSCDWLVEKRNLPWLQYLGIPAKCYDDPETLLALIFGRISASLVINSEQTFGLSAVLSKRISTGPIRGFFSNARRDLYSSATEYGSNEPEIEAFKRLISDCGLPAGKFPESAPLPITDTSNYSVVALAGLQASYKSLTVSEWAQILRNALQCTENVYFVGAKVDRAFSDQVVSTFGNKIINKVGKLKFEQVVALIRGAERLFSVDSGLVHVADFFNVPSEVVFTTSNPVKWGPMAIGSKVVLKSTSSD